MATRKEVMQDLVKEEAKNLKKNANKEELQRLNFKNLISNDYKYCIYGQITGDCYSDRAEALIRSGCTRVYDAKDTLNLGDSKVNGNHKSLDRDVFFSPIEVFIDQGINQTNGNNEKLIKYLKGKSRILNFK